MSLVLLAVAAIQAPTISFQDGAFRLQVADKRYEVPVSPVSALDTTKGTFRWTGGGIGVAFGPGGLTAGKPGALKPVSLKEFVTSPRFQTPEQIRETVASIQKKERSAEPAALSGFEVVDGKLVLLFRWEDKAGKPWLEALATLQESPGTVKAVGMGRLDGLGLASGRVDDKLFIHNGRLTAANNLLGKFGIASVAKDGSDNKFRTLGEEVGGVAWRPGLSEAFVTRPNQDGSVAISAVDTETGSWRSVLEYRGRIGNLLPEGWAKLVVGGVPWAANLATGAQVRLAANSDMAHTPFGLLVWAPARAPKEAWLFDANTRQVQAWRATVAQG